MAATAKDVNGALVRKVKGLPAAAKTALLNSYAKAPLMLRLVGFLEQQSEEKFRNQDAVAHLYGIKITHADYALYENRLFKLRKKLYDHLHQTPTEGHTIFTSFELQWHEIKQLTIIGKYQDAHALLTQLEAELWHNNIFEMLPDVLDLLVHNHQVQRNFAANETVYNRLDLAIALGKDLATAKMMARQVYDINLTLGATQTTALLQKLQRLSINHKQYPRFKLIYNLASATCKVAGGGLDFVPDFKVTSRCIRTLHQLHAQYPQMPDYRYIAGYTETQNYMFANFEVMNNFNAFRFKEAAVLMKQLYAQVTAESSSMKRIQGDVFFTSACLVLNLGDRSADALQVAKDYLKYLMDLKQTDKVLNAYMEMINAHITMYPAKSGLSNTIMFKKLGEFVKLVKGQPYDYYYLAMAAWIKVKLLLINGEYQEAQDLVAATDFSTYLIDARLSPEAASSIQLLLTTLPPEQKKKALAKQVEKLRICRLSCKLPSDYGNFKFLENLLHTYKVE